MPTTTTTTPPKKNTVRSFKRRDELRSRAAKPHPPIDPAGQQWPLGEPLVVTVAEACRLGAFSSTTFYKLKEQGKLRTKKIGKRVVVNYADLKALVIGDML